MPETRMAFRWPDGADAVCWSPSTIIRDHFKADEALPLDAFVAQAETALHAASERVRERYGSPCGIAARELKTLRTVAAEKPAGDVLILSIT